MSVHAYDEKIRLSIMAFEARYEDGYRYLDHCGETIVRIRHFKRSWVVGTAVPQGTTMVNAELGLALNFGNERINIANQGEVALSEGEKKAEILGNESEALYELVLASIKVPETSRIGIRYRFTAQADSLEEADRFVSRGARSPLLETVLKSARADLRDAAMFYVVEEATSGYRRRIAIESQVAMKAESPIHTGLEREGHASVSIDIDTFTRPETGHFQKSNFFIQNNYTRSWAIASEIFQWLRQQK